LPWEVTAFGFAEPSGPTISAALWRESVVVPLLAVPSLVLASVVMPLLPLADLVPWAVLLADLVL
jgi:hypothetical protein